MRLGLLVLCTLWPTLWPLASAHGYVRRHSESSGEVLSWATSCHAIRAASDGARDFSIDEIDAIVARAVANWQSRIGACSSQKLVAVSHAESATGVVEVSFTDDWPPPEARAACSQQPNDCAGTIAFTLLETPKPGAQPMASDNIIATARIVLNQRDFVFYDATSMSGCSGYDGQDLENTLTHELGHLLALGHTCLLPMETASAPVDSRGRVIVDCAANPPADVVAATMYPVAEPCSITLRSLSDDDVAGVCESYPAATPQPCFATVQGGCSLTPGGARPGSLAIIWLLVWAQRDLSRRRRQRGL